MGESLVEFIIAAILEGMAAAMDALMRNIRKRSKTV